MKIGVLGTGMVGKAITTKLLSLGHEVKIGTRSVEKLADWLREAGSGLSAGSFAESAAFGEILFNALHGAACVETLQAIDEAALHDKVMIDISNPLDFSHGMPPRLFISNDNSLGEQIQRAVPSLKVVKSLNTINCDIMVNPGMLPGEHSVFVSGNDAAAKAQVTTILSDWFGWQSVIDLGDIKTARTVEMYLPLWVSLMGSVGTSHFNIQIVK